MPIACPGLHDSVVVRVMVSFRVNIKINGGLKSGGAVKCYHSKLCYERGHTFLMISNCILFYIII